MSISIVPPMYSVIQDQVVTPSELVWLNQEVFNMTVSGVFAGIAWAILHSVIDKVNL